MGKQKNITEQDQLVATLQRNYGNYTAELKRRQEQFRADNQIIFDVLEFLATKLDEVQMNSGTNAERAQTPPLPEPSESRPPKPTRFAPTGAALVSGIRRPFFRAGTVGEARRYTHE